jgi:hypothetical protein
MNNLDLTDDEAQELLSLVHEWLDEFPGSMTRRAYLLRGVQDKLHDLTRPARQARQAP